MSSESDAIVETIYHVDYRRMNTTASFNGGTANFNGGTASAAINFNSGFNACPLCCYC